MSRSPDVEASAGNPLDQFDAAPYQLQLLAVLAVAYEAPLIALLPVLAINGDDARDLLLQGPLQGWIGTIGRT
jgi:hypothetical protein